MGRVERLEHAIQHDALYRVAGGLARGVHAHEQSTGQGDAVGRIFRVLMSRRVTNEELARALAEAIDETGEDRRLAEASARMDPDTRPASEANLTRWLEGARASLRRARLDDDNFQAVLATLCDLDPEYDTLDSPPIVRTPGTAPTT